MTLLTLSPTLAPTSRVATASHYHRLEARRHDLVVELCKTGFLDKTYH